MLKKVKRFTINRAKWLPREAQDRLRIDSGLSVDGRRCCLGAYLHACGFADKNLRAAGMPSHIYAGKTFLQQVGLLTKIGGNSDEANHLANVNDSMRTPLKRKEELIKAGFAELGVEVTFKGEMFSKEEK